VGRSPGIASRGPGQPADLTQKRRGARPRSIRCMTLGTILHEQQLTHGEIPERQRFQARPRHHYFWFIIAMQAVDYDPKRSRYRIGILGSAANRSSHVLLTVYRIANQATVEGAPVSMLCSNEPFLPLVVASKIRRLP